MSTKLSGSIGRDHYRTILHSVEHTWHADEPASNGGGDTGPSPAQLVVAALNFELFERLFCPDTALLLGHGEPATLPRRALSQPKTACSNSPKLSAATTSA